MYEWFNDITKIYINFIGWAGFGLVHSFMASSFLKGKIQSRMPQSFPFYRIIYTISQTILFFWLWIILPRPAIVLWELDGFLYSAFRTIQVISIILGVYSFRSFNLFEFIGMTQVKRYYKSHKIENTDEKYQLNTTGMYAISRHPLYLFTLTIFIFEPTMTGFIVIFTLWLFIYIYIGSYFEERRMLRIFGDAYRNYQNKVSRVFPLKYMAEIFQGRCE